MSTKPLRPLSLLLLLIAATSPTIVADEKDKPDDKKAEPQTKPGWVVVEEDVWARLNDEPSRLMQQSHRSYLKKEYDAAASELRKAGSYLHVAARNGSSDTKAALSNSARELDRLAGEVRAGTVKSVKTLESTFARAEHALAADHHTKTKSALAGHQQSTAGHYLHSAVTHVENAARWSGHELESGEAATAKGIRVLGDKLVEGSVVAGDEARKGVAWVGETFEKLGKYIEPHKQADETSKPAGNK